MGPGHPGDCAAQRWLGRVVTGHQPHHGTLVLITYCHYYYMGTRLNIHAWTNFMCDTNMQSSI